MCWIDLSMAGVSSSTEVGAQRWSRRVSWKEAPRWQSLGMSNFWAGKEKALTIGKSIVPKPKAKKSGVKVSVKQVGDRLCINTCLAAYDKAPSQGKWGRKDFCKTHGLRVQFIMVGTAQGQKCQGAGTLYLQWTQKCTNPGSQAAFFLSFSSGPQAMGWCCLQGGSLFTSISLA